MTTKINLKQPGAQVGDHEEIEASFEVEPFDLYGRHHEVMEANASVGITRVTEGVYLDLAVRATVRTTCDRTLELLDLDLEFGEAELVSAANSEELSVEDWDLDLSSYVGKTLPSEVPMQTFAPGTEPVRQENEEDEIDPRWRGLDDLFASGF